MNRKSFFLLPFLAALLSLCGCGMPEKTELNERLIIEAVGVDAAEAGFDVTVQALDSIAVGVDEGVPESGVTKCYTFHGTTVGEALAQIAPQTGLTPLYSQARLLVLGTPAAQDGLCETLDFFLREHHTRADITVAVAEHTAKEIVAASFGKNRVGADILQDALEQTGSGGAPMTPLYRFLNLLLNENDAAFCPLLGLEENPLSEDQLVRMRGAVLFRGTKIGTVLSAHDLPALRALTDGLTGACFTLPAGDARCTLRIARSKTKVRLTDAEGPLRFRIKLNAVCDITELSAGSFAPLDTAQIDRAAEALSRRLTADVSSLLRRSFYENGCDVCRFSQRLRLRRPALYRRKTADGPLSPADVSCEVECRVTVRRTGKEILRQSKA